MNTNTLTAAETFISECQRLGIRARQAEGGSIDLGTDEAGATLLQWHFERLENEYPDFRDVERAIEASRVRFGISPKARNKSAPCAPQLTRPRFCETHYGLPLYPNGRCGASGNPALMQFNEYQRLGARTDFPEHLPPTTDAAGLVVQPLSRFMALELRERVLKNALGLPGEVGELVELVKKWAFHDAALNLPQVEKEAGDVLWYLAQLLDAFGLPLEKCAVENIAKLRRRYPEEYSHEACAAKADEADVNSVEWHRDPAASGWRSRASVDGKCELIAYDDGRWEVRGPPHGHALVEGRALPDPTAGMLGWERLDLKIAPSNAAAAAFGWWRTHIKLTVPREGERT